MRSTKDAHHFKPVLAPREYPVLWVVDRASSGWLFTKNEGCIRFYRGHFKFANGRPGLRELKPASLKGVDRYLYELYRAWVSELVLYRWQGPMPVQIHTRKYDGQTRRD